MTSTDMAVVEQQAIERSTVVDAIERAVGLPAGAINLNGLELVDPDMLYENWITLGQMLGEANRWTRWAIGDWFNFGAGNYGEDPALQVTESTRADRMDVLHRTTALAPGTLANYSSICGRIPLHVRRAELEFTVHEPVAALERSDQIYWLEQAVAHAWTREELRLAIKDAKRPPVEGDDDTPEVIDRPLSIADRIENAARLVYGQGQMTSDGSALVPPEAWSQLGAALGEE